MLDYLIIGGGVAGLYFAMKCRGKSLILEKNDRLGGRAYNTKFGDKDVGISLGAGIGVASVDDLLIQLMNFVGLEYHSFYINVESERCQDVLKKLYDNMNKIEDTMTFTDYINIVLTEEEIAIFKHDNGFTDFYEADAKTTMLEYGLNENCSKYIALSINWSELIERMSKKCEYRLSCKVLSIEGAYPKFTVVTDKGNYTTKNVVIAGTISTIKRFIDDPIYDRIKPHPFMRVYASFSERNKKIMERHFISSRVVGGKLHFIIPIKENVWMIAYTDGEDAIDLREEFISSYTTKEEREKHRRKVAEKYLKNICGEEVLIEDMRVAFWKEGTHYYTPGGDIDFRKLRNPRDGLYICGEVVSYSQGWCNGALMTVDDVMSSIS